MKSIEDMAHEYAMQCIASSSSSLKTNQDIINHAWAYADAMKAEADKRRPVLDEARMAAWQRSLGFGVDEGVDDE